MNDFSKDPPRKMSFVRLKNNYGSHLSAEIANPGSLSVMSDPKGKKVAYICDRCQSVYPIPTNRGEPENQNGLKIALLIVPRSLLLQQSPSGSCVTSNAKR